MVEGRRKSFMMEDVRGKKEEIPTPTTIPTPLLIFNFFT
jgi:hypothetical protein